MTFHEALASLTLYRDHIDPVQVVISLQSVILHVHTYLHPLDPLSTGGFMREITPRRQ